MKSANALIKWIFFVPVFIFSFVMTLLGGLFPSVLTNSLSMSQNTLFEIIAFSVLGLFGICLLISLLDKKTSPLYILRKNYFCTVSSILCAFGLASSAALDVTNMFKSSSVDFMTIVVSVLAAVSGVAMLFIGLNHLTGVNSKTNISLLYLSLPLWCVAHLIDRFLGHTATPVEASDTMDLVMFVALAMFFINSTMVHSLIQSKNAVKSSVNFGFPATVVTIVYGLSQLFAVINTQPVNYINIIPAVTYILIGLYVLSFTAELSFRAKTVEEQRIIVEATSDLTEDDDTEDTNEYGDSYDTTVPYYAEQEKEELIADEDLSDVPSDFVDEADDDCQNCEPAAVRVAVEDTEDFDRESSAQDLIKAAQQSDNRQAQPVKEDSIGSDDMIIEGETERKVSVVGNKTPRPKGVTVRETITYGDENFILSVEGREVNDFSLNKDEDISDFVLTPQETPDDNKSKKKNDDDTEASYDSRLDEIDRLIISIQGGKIDSSTENIDTDASSEEE